MLSSFGAWLSDEAFSDVLSDVEVASFELVDVFSAEFLSLELPPRDPPTAATRITTKIQNHTFL
ncbi:hypothetical protein HSIEG1_2952 [Enterococcus sp. HSIEG1]|nr:hypothetical protein HSIEG1_2952 [Enterococcus sp. HSIEG1]